MTGPTLFLAPMRVEERALRKAGIPTESIVRIGMGRAKSLAAVERLRTRSFDRLVIAGVCGSLDPLFCPGDVRRRAHDADRGSVDDAHPLILAASARAPVIFCCEGRGLLIYENGSSAE